MASRNENIQAHVYATKAGALAAIDIINTGEGIPVSSKATTRTYTAPIKHDDGTWYIYADEVTMQYLPAPETVILTIEIPD